MERKAGLKVDTLMKRINLMRMTATEMKVKQRTVRKEKMKEKLEEMKTIREEGFQSS